MELSTRLAALNTLLTYVNSWVARANEGKIGTNEYPDYKYWVEERRPLLIRELDLLYKQIYGTDEA